MDWNKIKTEYVTTDISYKKLHEKYGVSMRTLADRAKREKWVELRQRNRDKTVTKMIARESQKQIDRYTRIISVTDKLLEKIEKSIDAIEAGDVIIDKAGIRSIAGAIKDIKEIQGLKSDLDRMEQEARIKKLQKESESEDNTAKVIISIEGGDDSWQS